jgi:Domain of unknown function (DUF4214)/RTX calcium-binding nonapeptide repeat (4 copies)
MAIINGTEAHDALDGTEDTDTIQGGGGRDALRGFGGVDALFGGDRYDVLLGGTGADLLDGGAGFDLAAYWFDPAAIFVDLQAGAVVDGSGAGDRLVDIEAVFGTNYADTFRGSVGNDVMVGLYGDDTMHGFGGHDLLVGDAGDDWAHGGDGHDAFVVAVGRRAGQVASGADGVLTLASALGTDRLREVEEIRFLDGRLVFSADDPAMQVVRLYKAGLDRVPDQGGLDHWIGSLRAGVSLSQVASGFADGPEFTARFGGPALSHAAYVDRLYQNVLGRAGEEGGRDYWITQLQAGLSRAEILVGFSESAENRANTAGLAAAGVWDADETMAVVGRLYHAALGRRPDTDGFNYWKTGIEDPEHGFTVRDVAAAFLSSPEFQATYGALSNRDYATALYRNTLGREPDQAGLEHWTSVLDAGRHRVDVLLDFSESTEHVALTAAVISGTGPGDPGIVFA